ncbi:MAG: SGNH/GDSL hydrolase family protein [Mucinivorans sp.]
MKKILLVAILVCVSCLSMAQTRWVDAKELSIGGHGPWLSATPYERLPSEMKGTVREALWNLGCNSSGLYVRFRTDSPSVWAQWTLTGNTSMYHMTEVGIKGVDLYFLDGSQWRYIATGGAAGINTSRRLIGNMKPEMREYMMYLPLYEGVSEVKIGVDSAACLAPPHIDSPKREDERPMVFYGTSIMQGACASRPGMNSTSIIARAMNREAINLGFSGNAKLDYQIARAMATIKNPHSYVLDFAPNCTPQLIESNMERFIGILRNSHPTVPIVVVEQTYFPPMVLDTVARAEQINKSATMRRVYDSLVKGGDKNLYWVPGAELLGTDNESQVDALHATDLGFMRYAESLLPVLKQF